MKNTEIYLTLKILLVKKVAVTRGHLADTPRIGMTEYLDYLALYVFVLIVEFIGIIGVEIATLDRENSIHTCVSAASASASLNLLTKELGYRLLRHASAVLA
jgi:hypothetical protein